METIGREREDKKLELIGKEREDGKVETIEREREDKEGEMIRKATASRHLVPLHSLLLSILTCKERFFFYF